MGYNIQHFIHLADIFVKIIVQIVIVEKDIRRSRVRVLKVFQRLMSRPEFPNLLSSLFMFCFRAVRMKPLSVQITSLQGTTPASLTRRTHLSGSPTTLQ